MNGGQITSSSVLGLATVCLVILAWIPAQGQEAAIDSLSTTDVTSASDSIPPDFLILPAVNYSEKGEAHDLLLPRMHEHLYRQGMTFVTSDSLRPLLRKHRIRSRGWVGLEAARVLRRETLASYLLLGSWDVFRTETNPEIGFSLRILDLEHMRVIGAVSVGMTGADFTKALGLGRITDISELADIAMERAFAGLFPLPPPPTPRPSYRGCFQVALIPFDNYSGVPNAGDIMTNIVLSRLLAQGYFVVEPGFVRELGLTLEIVNRGGVDRKSSGSILASFDACRVITGSVEKFATSRGDPTLIVPELALGIRVMSPRDGNLYMMEELRMAGDDGEGMFQGGRVHAVVSLANKMLQDFLDEVAENNREDILYGDHSQ